MPKPDQTEKATPKRLSEARQRGQVARSTELAGAVVFFASVFVLNAFAGSSITGIGNVLRSAIANAFTLDTLTIRSVWLLFVQALAGAGFLLAFLFAVSLVVALAVNFLQVGFLFTLKPLQPSFSKINPLSGFKRIFSKQVVANLAKQLVKLSAVVVLVFGTIAGNLDFFARIGNSSLGQTLVAVSGLIYGIAWKFGLMLVIVALLDYVYERWQYHEGLKMTKQEVKDEARQYEGSPELRGALKRRQREFARRRMMQAVPRATVVVTNPTHFAVAIEWDEVKMEAPVVTAKGSDLLAKRIRELARESGVPIMENPPLARTLYDNVELDQAIPPNLYAAVAQVIAFVYKLKRRTIA